MQFWCVFIIKGPLVLHYALVMWMLHFCQFFLSFFIGLCRISGANLWRSKIWRLSFFFTTFPPGMSTDPHPSHPDKLTQPPMGMAIRSRNHRFDARNNLCQWGNMCKNAPETVLQIRKIQVLSQNVLNLKLRHWKAQKMILSGRYMYGDPYGRAGDQCCIRESWHVWNLLTCKSM